MVKRYAEADGINIIIERLRLKKKRGAEGEGTAFLQ